ncbi:CidA/LrgA family protein [Comamonas aquatica]|uniref:CidA/LrgA family protein n=1 Tax=Comamonas aquatica TaxID=225991 RepID=UPI0005A6C1BE|nr:CidA/LrgA family protein [Comamonas aquatica]
MLYALAALFAFQLAGEALVHALALPLPGALVGTLLLLTALLWLGRLPVALEQTALTLLQNMMLLFIPTIAGVVLHFDRIAREWQPFVVAGVAGAAITYVVTALTFRWMLARSPAAATTPGAPT